MRRIVLMVLAVVAIGCGSTDPGGGTGGVSPAKAQADCTAYLSFYCTKLISCIADTTMADCLTLAQSAIDCAKVVSETSEVPLCKAELTNATCTGLVSNNAINIPAACKMIFLYP